MRSSADPVVERELNLAMQSFRAGDAQGAMRRVDGLFPSHSDRPDVLVAKGVLLVATGELAAGLDFLVKGLRKNPSDPEALAWAAHAAIGLKAFQEAENHARRFVSLQANSPRGYFLLALAQEGSGQAQEALTSIENALSIQPNDIEALLVQARLLRDLAMPNLASKAYRHVLSIRKHPGAAIALAQILLLTSRSAEALSVLEESLPMLPEHLQPYDLIAQAQTELRRFEEAEKSWGLANRYSPDRVMVARRRAAAEIAAGRFELAETQLRELLDSGIDPVRSFYALTHARKMRPDDAPLIEQMEALLSSSDWSPLETVVARSALGKTYDDLGEYALAIGHFDEANRLNYEMYLASTRNPETIARVRSFADAQLRSLKDRNVTAHGNPSELPILVMGMPRSGTTLTASILCAHSKVAGGEENSFWRERSMSMETWAKGQMSLDQAAAERFAAEYLEFLAFNSPNVKHIVDKTPANCYRAAILHRLLPNARMIHLLRHPVDNMLSIWMNLFQDFGSFTSNRANLVATYREHKRLVRGLEESLPSDRFRVLRYEQLTSAPLNTIGSLLDFLGLENEPACFEPEKSTRTIKTPSVLQVRQPINPGSQNRWKHYEPWLGEFAELLEEEAS